MLLQRASAGSGKTYKLAKTFIRLFISVREEGSDFYRLLKPAEVRDAHSHILGITFTNKATNEMKQRIVETLAALACPVPAEGMEPEGYKFPDYLLSYTGEEKNADPKDDIIYISKGIPAGRHEITETCRAALSTLLNNYSNFNISTIDSFFQGVLRTLAYELHLNDTYHVELNDEYLAQMGVNDTLSSIKESNPSESRRRMADYMNEWLYNIMQLRLQQGDAWDAFTPKDSGIYGELVNIAKKMSSESFKRNLHELDSYFEDPQRFATFYRGVLREQREVEALHLEMQKAAKKFLAETESVQNHYIKGVESVLKGALKVKPYGSLKSNKKLETNRTGEYNGTCNIFKKNTSPYSDATFQADFTAFCDAYFAWRDAREYWSAVLSRLHYLGVLYYINISMEEFRDENNIIPLNATNEILNRIIGKDEVPFIYERTGVQLHHFLLDEFQDTSRLQWENLQPLLAQSDSQKFENLIIGDAKQSIYRFRNADPELINSQVKIDFPFTRVLPDDLSTEQARADVNANWRSSREVVQFNNTIFKSLAPILDDEEPDNSTIFRSLYSNTVQAIRKKDLPGYVEIDFKSKNGFDTLGEKIMDLLSRNYKQSDIAILVNLNSDGKTAINSIVNFNAKSARLAKEEGLEFKPIDFISEESLLINSSPAVKVLLSVMSLISNDFIISGSDRDSGSNTDENNKHLRPFELSQLEANYNIALSLGSATRLADIETLNRSVKAEQVEELYRRMGATTLPAMVEAIASAFLTPEMLTTQAAYLSAFQDHVLEYCETYTPDLSSFLSWWNENGNKYSIAAPEGVDAVKIITIHKSKGLEFKAVIIPKADWELGPFKEEEDIIWTSHVPRGLTEEEQQTCPDVMPVTPNGKSMNNPSSPFFEEYHKFFLESRIDSLNKTYVAFTRAIRELYISSPSKSPLGSLLQRAILDAQRLPTDTSGMLMQPGEYTFNDDRFTLGKPTDLAKDKKKKDDIKTENRKEQQPKILLIKSYAPFRPLRSSDANFMLSDDD